MYNNFVKYCLSHGGKIISLDIPSDITSHLGICNPSIYIEDDDKIRLILRNVNYALWSNDNEHKFNSVYGPLYYITRDDDQHLRTRNFLCELNENTNEITYNLIDTSDNDWEPIWEFVGQEDMRLVRWNKKLYGTGVQRDWNITGVGRMHLSELDENTGKELSRVRIETPNNEISYCEKNWMPILDMPYHYVRLCNPTTIIKTNPKTGKSKTVINKIPDSDIEFLNTDNMQIRGSSQVIPWGEYRIALVHLCTLWINEKGQKSSAGYYEQFIVWDKDWNIVKMSTPFRFADFGVEFTNGMAYKDGTFYIPFALQDNLSFMVTVNEDILHKFIFDKDYKLGNTPLSGDLNLEYFNNTTDSYMNIKFANKYFSLGHYAAAMVLYNRASEYNNFNNIDDLYSSVFMGGKSIALLDGRDAAEEDMWLRLVNLDPNRPEGYIMLGKYYSWRSLYNKAYTVSKIALTHNNYKYISEFCEVVNEVDALIEFLKAKYYTEDYLAVEDELKRIEKAYNLNDFQSRQIADLLNMINDNKINKVRVL